MAFFIALTLSFIPAFVYASMVYWLDRFEKEPMRLLVGAFFWGAFVATMGAIIWTSVLQFGVELLVGSELADIAGTALLAPIVEEILKGLGPRRLHRLLRRGTGLGAVTSRADWKNWLSVAGHVHRDLPARAAQLHGDLPGRPVWTGGLCYAAAG